LGHAGLAWHDPLLGYALMVTALSLMFAFREELRGALLE